MFYLRRPADAQILAAIAAGASQPFTYRDVGATRTTPPADFRVDHTRAWLGQGEVAFHVACQALRSWRQFALGWLAAVPPEAPLTVGATVAVVAHALGPWSINLARIVYVVDDLANATTEPVRRFGFAYGTLPDHIASGEERFLIEWNTTSDAVYYDILAFSRPRHPLARLAQPLVRRTQKHFGRESAAALQAAVAAANA